MILCLFAFYKLKSVKIFKDKKLDIFNFFYSFAAVIILIGVIAKLLEWPSQDILITFGLGVEAFVFAVSAIKFIDKKKKDPTNKNESKTLNDNSELTPPPLYIKDLSKEGSGLVYEKKETQSQPPKEITHLSISDNFEKQNVFETEDIYEVNNIELYKASDVFEIAPNIIEYKEEIKSEKPTEFGHNKIKIQEETMPELEKKEINISSLPSTEVKGDNLFLNRFRLYLFDLKWVSFSIEDYDFLRDIVLKIFKRELPHSSIFQLLQHTTLNLPSASIDDFNFENSHEITLKEFQLIVLLLKTSGLEIFFEKHIIETIDDNQFIIRKRKNNEFQIFGEINQNVLSYAKNNFSSNIFISSQLENFKNLSHFHELDLINYFVANISQDSYEQINDLLSIVSLKSDTLLINILNKITPIDFHFSSTSDSYELKTILKILSLFDDFSLTKSLFHSKINFFDIENTYFEVQDLIRFKSSSLIFGKNNENKIELSDLFTSSYLNREKQIKNLTNTLLEEDYLDHEFVYTVFDNLKTDNKHTILNKLNDYLNSSNTQPNNAQLAFILLLKHSD
tara:strand:- start:2600 stop:4294 length:1695 start_codon:yes stop_codon:yes gene_type:complete